MATNTSSGGGPLDFLNPLSGVSQLLGNLIGGGVDIYNAYNQNQMAQRAQQAALGQLGAEQAYTNQQMKDNMAIRNQALGNFANVFYGNQSPTTSSTPSSTPTPTTAAPGPTTSAGATSPTSAPAPAIGGK